MNDQQNFNPDRPIESAEQDKLGRTRFAQQLAERISNWRGQESLVIGLYGDWGAGKSSAKNLILENLRKAGDASPTVVEFNPWLVSGEEKITRAFFDEVGSKLEKGDTDAATKARAASWKKYAHALEFTSRMATAFDLVSPLLGVMSPGAGAWAAKRLKKAQELAESAAKSVEEKSVSLDEAKRDLRTYFRGLTRPLLVVIDDIDRLAAMMAPCSVKATGNFGENLSRERWSQFVTTSVFSTSVRRNRKSSGKRPMLLSCLWLFFAGNPGGASAFARKLRRDKSSFAKATEDRCSRRSEDYSLSPHGGSGVS